MALGTEFSARAQRLIAWIASRNTPTHRLLDTEVATAIGSRRHAPGVIGELIQAGLMHRVKDFLLVSKPILEFAKCAAGGAAGVLPGVAKATDDAVPTTPAASCATGDLRALQHAQVLSRAGLETRGSAAGVSSIPEGDAYETQDSSIKLVTKNSLILDLNIYNNISDNRMGARSQERANTASDLSPSENQPWKPTCAPRRNSRNGNGVIAMAQERAKRVVKNHEQRPVTVALGEEAAAAKAYGIAVEFESQLGVYVCRPALRYLKGRVAKGQPNFANWLRAAQAADELGVDYATFVRAQFWAFDAWFSRAPKPQELGSRTSASNALERCKQYLDAVAAGKHNPTSAIVGRQRSVTDTTTSKGRQRAATLVDDATRFQHSETQLRVLMRNWGLSAEEVFRKFAKGPAARAYFDAAWMRQHPVYARLKAAGEV